MSRKYELRRQSVRNVPNDDRTSVSRYVDDNYVYMVHVTRVRLKGGEFRRFRATAIDDFRIPSKVSLTGRDYFEKRSPPPSRNFGRRRESFFCFPFFPHHEHTRTPARRSRSSVPPKHVDRPSVKFSHKFAPFFGPPSVLLALHRTSRACTLVCPAGRGTEREREYRRRFGQPSRRNHPPVSFRRRRCSARPVSPIAGHRKRPCVDDRREIAPNTANAFAGTKRNFVSSAYPTRRVEFVRIKIDPNETTERTDRRVDIVENPCAPLGSKTLLSV